MKRLKAYLEKDRLEAGCDEAGRGCLAGPVFAAAVILPDNFYHPELNDSKKISVTKREKLKAVIEQEAIGFGIAMATPAEIDDINILRASILAMHRALDKLSPAPGHILVDGNHFSSYRKIEHTTVIKGDQKYASVAAASILAKTSRDSYMKQLHDRYPQYGWAENKGYPTYKHRQAIQAYGVTTFHRTSFSLLSERLSLGLR